MTDGVRVEIDKAQLERIMRSLDPAKVREDTSRAIRGAADTAHNAALHNLRGGTEQAGYSMRVRVQSMEAKVYSLMSPTRVKSIEEGRKPGEWVPYLQAARHITGDRYLTQRMMDERYAETGKYLLSLEQHKAIRKFQYSIVHSGAKAKKFLAGGAEAAKKEITAWVDFMARKIERGWGR